MTTTTQTETRRCFESCCVVMLRRGRVTSQRTPGYNTGKDPATLIHDPDTLTVSVRDTKTAQRCYLLLFGVSLL